MSAIFRSWRGANPSSTGKEKVESARSEPSDRTFSQMATKKKLSLTRMVTDIMATSKTISTKKRTMRMMALRAVEKTRTLTRKASTLSRTELSTVDSGWAGSATALASRRGQTVPATRDSG